MKLWPVEVWEQWRAGRAQQRFLALTARPRPPTQALWIRRPFRSKRLVGRMFPRRMEAAQYGNLRGSVGLVVLPSPALVVQLSQEMREAQGLPRRLLGS